MAGWRTHGSRTPAHRRLSAGLLGLGLTVGLAAVPGTSLAKPASTVAGVQRQVGALAAAERSARIRYAAAARAEREAQARLTATSMAVSAAQAKLSRVRASIGELAAATYRSGGPTPLLRLLLAEDPDMLLRSADWVEQSAQYQAEAVSRLAGVQRELARRQQAQEHQVATLRAVRAGMAAQQRAASEKSAEIQRLLAGLRAADRKRLAPAPRPAASANLVTPAVPAARPRTGSCPPSGGRGAEARLTPATLTIMRCGLAAFPQIRSAGGWGTRGNATDHDDGRAVDFMIADYRSPRGNDFGWAVAEWATKQPSISYVIFDQMQYGTWNRRWSSMSNRGSDTANHRDHVHVSVSR